MVGSSFYGRVERRKIKQLLPAKFEPVYKDFRGHTKGKDLWCQTKYRDMEQLLFVMKIFWMIFLENIKEFVSLANQYS